MMPASGTGPFHRLSPLARGEGGPLHGWKARALLPGLAWRNPGEQGNVSRVGDSLITDGVHVNCRSREGAGSVRLELHGDLNNLAGRE